MKRLRSAPATMGVFAAILAGFVVEVLTGAWKDPERLANLGAVVGDWIFQDGEYWRLLTAMFLHGDGTVGGTLLHLFVNLLALFQVGSLFEVMFGKRRFLTVYFVTGLIASLTSALRNAGASVGASGAIFGILGAFVISVRRSPRWRHEPSARSIANQLVFWIVFNIIVLGRIPNIDNSAHIGGLVAGLLLGAVLPHPAPPPPPPRQVIVDVAPYEG